MAQLALYLLIASLFFILGLPRPKLAFLALAVVLPLSHEGIQMALIGYRPERMTPLLMTVATASLFVATFFRNTRPLVGAIYKSLHVVLPYLMFLVTAVSVNFAYNGFTHSVVLLDNYIGPMCLFLLAVAYFPRDPSLASVSCRIILVIMAAGVLFSLYEYSTGSNPVMMEYIRTVDPLLSDSVPGGRTYSLFGHFLVTASLFVFAIALTFALMRSWWALLFAIWFYLGIAMTQSRAGLFIGGVLLAYGTIRLSAAPRRRLSKKLALAAALLLLIPAFILFAYWLPKAPVFAAIVDRFQTAPVQDRVEGLFSFQAGSLLGKGIGEGNRVAERLGNITGLENPWAYLVQDFGFVGTLCYAAALLGVFFTRDRGASARSSTSAMATARDLKVFLFLQILMFSTFNGFGNRNNANYIVWFLAALIVAGSRPKPNRGTGKGQPSGAKNQPTAVISSEGPFGGERAND